MKQYKLKTKKAVVKRFRITKNGKVLRSHQLRSTHLRSSKSKKALRRHQVVQKAGKGQARQIRRMLGV